MAKIKNKSKPFQTSIKTDMYLHDDILAEGDKKFEGSVVQQDAIRRAVELVVDIELAKKLYSSQS